MAVETNLTELTALIVASFALNNSLVAGELPDLISATHAALVTIESIRVCADDARKPAVPIQDSIAQEYLVCLNDGRKLRSLKRYIQRKFALSPEQYREKWGLPDDYPMVAPAYSALRAKIARQRSRK